MMRHVDPAEYVLGLLEGEDLERARTLEREDPSFGAEVRRLRSVSVRLGTTEEEEWGPVAPPALDLGAITGAAPAAQAAGAPARTSLWERVREAFSGPGLTLRPGLAVAASAFLIAAGVGGGVLLSGSGEEDGGQPAGQVVALERFDDGPQGASATANVADAGGTREVTIDADGLKPSAEGTFYEVWMIRDAKRMQSLGTFRVGPDGKAVVQLPVTVDPEQYPVMDISIQKADAGPAHSGVSVLRSETTTRS